MHHLCTPKDRDAGQDRSGAKSWAQLRWWLMIKHVKATLTGHGASLRVAQVREKISSQQQIMKQIKAPWGLCQPGEPGSLQCRTRVLQSHFDGACFFLQATLCKMHKHAVDFPVSVLLHLLRLAGWDVPLFLDRIPIRVCRLQLVKDYQRVRN